MAGLDDLLREARRTPEHARAKSLARNDYKLLTDLVAVRKKNGFSQDDVAALLDITQQAVSKLESYDSDPKLSTLRRYAHAIGAVVEHKVAPDDGRLEIHKGWIAASYAKRAPMADPADSADDSERRTYAASTSKRLAFALAA